MKTASTCCMRSGLRFVCSDRFLVCISHKLLSRTLRRPIARNAGARPSPTAAPAPPPRPRSYREISGIKAIPGLFTLHRKDEKVWIEIRHRTIRRAVLLRPTTSRAASASAGCMAVRWAVRTSRLFHRIGERVQLIARNEKKNFSRRRVPRRHGSSLIVLRQPHCLGASGIAADPETKASNLSKRTRCVRGHSRYLTRLEIAFRIAVRARHKEQRRGAGQQQRAPDRTQDRAHYGGAQGARATTQSPRRQRYRPRRRQDHAGPA